MCRAVSSSMLASSRAKQTFLSIFHSHSSSNILFRSSPNPHIYLVTVSLCFFIYMCHKVSMCFILQIGILTWILWICIIPNHTLYLLWNMFNLSPVYMQLLWLNCPSFCIITISILCLLNNNPNLNIIFQNILINIH